MPRKTKPKGGYLSPMVNVNARQLKQARSIEDILCLSTLIANDRLDRHATVTDAGDYYDSLGIDGCAACPFEQKCLASIINE